MQLFELAVKNKSITSADIEAILDEEEKANEEDVTNVTTLATTVAGAVANENTTAKIVTAAATSDMDDKEDEEDEKKEEEDDDDDDDSLTAPTGDDLRSNEEKEEQEDNDIIDDIVKYMQCPMCTANPIGTNIKDCEICRFAPPPTRKAVIEARKLISEIKELLDSDIDDKMYDINTDGSLKPRKRKQQHRPEGFVKRVKEYYYWHKQMKEKEQLGATR